MIGRTIVYALPTSILLVIARLCVGCPRLPLRWRRRTPNVTVPIANRHATSTSTHIHLCSKVVGTSTTSTWQEDNRLSADPRDGHTKILNLELQVRHCSSGMYISYSVFPKKEFCLDEGLKP